MARLVFITITIFLISIIDKINSLDIIYALNAGGDAFTDSLGIRYRRDFLNDGVPSDYGKMLDIKRVSAQDKILYQTERYSTETFGYTIPMPAGDADYVLWLKFCEVWFNAARLKVFDVSLNNVVVVKDLDIFDRVGRGVAHDEMVAFQIRQNKILINGKSLPFNNEIRVEFIKTDLDNPKVNAIIIMKGKLEDVPQLPPFKQETSDDFEESEDNNDERSFNENNQKQSNHDNDDDDDEDDDYNRNENENKQNNRRKKNKQQATPKIVDPYASDETSYLLPILVTIGAFIPLLYCLCRL